MITTFSYDDGPASDTLSIKSASPTDNLISSFFAKMTEIGGINIVKIIAANGGGSFDFSTIGTCEQKQVKNSDELNQLSDHYLVWYKPNDVGRDGWNVNGSINYRLSEYYDGLTAQKIPMRHDINQLIQSLNGGMKEPIEIMVAFDTSLKTGLIVDGTKRAISLYYLMHKNSGSLDNLLSSSQHPVRILQLSSPHCRLLFPCDFLKMCLKPWEGQKWAIV